MKKYWAKLDDDNTVVQVGIWNDSVSDEARADALAEQFGGVWVRTDKDTSGGAHYTNGELSADQSQAFRYNFASAGHTFDASAGADGAFIPEKPQDDAVLDTNTYLWTMPTPEAEEPSENP